MNKEPKTQMNLSVPTELYIMFSGLCMKEDITRAEGIARYFRYLRSQHHKKRRLLDEYTESTYELADSTE